MKQHGTEEELVTYKKAIDRVLAELKTRLLDPIYAEYPDLDPDAPSSRQEGSSSGASPPPGGERSRDTPEEPGSGGRSP